MTNGPRRRHRPEAAGSVSPSFCGSIYFFLAGAAAAGAALPPALPAAPFFSLVAASTPLMTPTATVWRMSRTAKRPSGGNSAKVSTHIGLLGMSLIMAASPDLTLLGFSSMALLVRRSIFSTSSANLQAMWAVWQSSTGV